MLFASFHGLLQGSVPPVRAVVNKRQVLTEISLICCSNRDKVDPSPPGLVQKEMTMVELWFKEEGVRHGR
jgi:hypothetical protein